MLYIALLAGCGDKDTDTAAAAAEDTAVEEIGYAAAELAPLSSGECPDMSASMTTSTFLSSGEERKVTIVFPEDRPEGMRVIFFFHGLMDPGSTPDPTEYMASALDLQSIAEEMNAIVVLPESPIWNMFGYEFFLWAVEEGTSEADLTLYDDLRTCIGEEFSPNLDQFTAMGLSGGALFTTIVAGERADTLASVVEMSGGSDIEVALAEGIIAPYTTPSWQVPSLLVTGGEADVWPDPSLVLVDFTAATDNLEASLAADGHYVVRCEHSSGHTITTPEFEAAKDWVMAHTYGEPSPYVETGIGDWSSWCREVE